MSAATYQILDIVAPMRELGSYACEKDLGFGLVGLDLGSPSKTRILLEVGLGTQTKGVLRKKRMVRYLNALHWYVVGKICWDGVVNEHQETCLVELSLKPKVHLVSN
jgi:hypothetical protein